LGFGISFWQATFAALVGTTLSFLLVGFSSLAGKKSNAPTMVLSRASFGVKGNIVPGLLSYILLVGWETVLISLATLATGTIFERLGTFDRNIAMVAGFVVAITLTISAGVLGHSIIMKIQKYLTAVTLLATVIYIALTIDSVNWEAVNSIPQGSSASVIGALIFAVTGIGLGWVNCAADYSRYLPRSTSSRAVVGWTVFGASIVPIVLVIYGCLLAGSSQKLSEAIATDPIGALTTILPTWFLAVFALIAIFGLVGGAILDLYSSGLTLISIGLPVKRHIAASIDALVMLIGTIYIVWFAPNFFIPFQGFLITLGVPVAAWSAIFVTDVLLRSRYDQGDLYKINGRYGAWNFGSISVLVIATIVGWGFVTNGFASWLSWQGYLLAPLGGKEGEWAYANLGVLFALFIGFIGYSITGRKRIRNQELAK
jgi:nucleobase:cation symporter-1, NCS1 family